MSYSTQILLLDYLNDEINKAVEAVKFAHIFQRNMSSVVRFKVTKLAIEVNSYISTPKDSLIYLSLQITQTSEILCRVELYMKHLNEPRFPKDLGSKKQVNILKNNTTLFSFKHMFRPSLMPSFVVSFSFN